MISVIIPTFNSAKTIAKTLESIYHQKDIDGSEYEVLVVDDCSCDSTIDIINNFPARLISLEKNSGPAAVRNLGVKQAIGETLIFIDSDVILKNNVLAKIKKMFIERNDIAALAGIYAKEPANAGPFRTYLALRKYSNWFDPKREFISFLVVSLGAIKRDVFDEFGGFDVRYKGADVEDFELGYRIAEKYKIILAEDIQGYHHFPGLIKTSKNFFKRSFQWIELFGRRKKFSSEAATTKKRALTNFAGFISYPLFILSFLYPPLCIAAVINLAFFILGNIRFYRFVVKEKGFIFMLYSFLLDYLFALIVGTAALLSGVNQCRLRAISK